MTQREPFSMLGRPDMSDSAGCPVNERCRVSFACATAGGKGMPIPSRHALAKGERLDLEDRQDAYAVKSGVIAVYESTRSGRREMYGISGPGRVIQADAFFPDVRAPQTIEALADTVICTVSRDAIRRACADDPTNAAEVARAISDETLKLQLHVWVMYGANLHNRLRRYLFAVAAAELDYEAEWITLAVTHDLLALVLNTNRESITRALRRLAADGDIDQSYGQISVRNPLSRTDLADDEDWSPEAESRAVRSLGIIG